MDLPESEYTASSSHLTQAAALMRYGKLLRVKIQDALGEEFYMITISYIGRRTKRPNIQSIYLDGRELEHRSFFKL